MKEIKLGSKKHPGLVALVDDADFDWLDQWKWHPKKRGRTFYAARSDTKNRKVIKMHRQILDLKDPKVLCDHKDYNGLNNLRSNLRQCNPYQNNANRRSMQNGSSKYLGVMLRKNSKKYTAQICTNGLRIHLGYFDNEINAAAAYNKAALELHGEFAHLNKI